MLMYLLLHFNFGYYRKVGLFCKTKKQDSPQRRRVRKGKLWSKAKEERQKARINTDLNDKRKGMFPPNRLAGRKKLIYFKSSFCEKTLTIFIMSSMVDLVFGSKHSSTMAAISFIECFPSQHVQTEAAVMFKLCASSFSVS